MLKKAFLLVVLILSMLLLMLFKESLAKNEGANVAANEMVFDKNIIKVVSIDKISTKENKLGERVAEVKMMLS